MKTNPKAWRARSMRIWLQVSAGVAGLLLIGSAELRVGRHLGAYCRAQPKSSGTFYPAPPPAGWLGSR